MRPLSLEVWGLQVLRLGQMFVVVVVVVVVFFGGRQLATSKKVDWKESEDRIQDSNVM